MFGKLKDKLKNAVKIFSKEASESEDITETEVKETIKETKKPTEKPVIIKEPVVDKIESEKEIIPVHEDEDLIIQPEKIIEAPVNDAKENTPSSSTKIDAELITETKSVPEKSLEEKPVEKKGFFSKLKEKVTTTKISEDKFDDLFWDLELGLLESDVAVEVIEKIRTDLRNLLTEDRVSKGKEQEAIIEQLKKTITELFVEPFDLIEEVKKEKPYVISVIGVNGCGKTTTMAKLAYLLQKSGLKVVIAAADTFRAAAIDQAKHHAEKLNIPIISQGYGADPAAVAFDAIKYGKAKNLDVVLIDTAGRLHSNTNLMNELEKLIRVNKPHLKIFVGEAITGNDAINQSRQFNDLVGIDAIILTKADVDEKGGASISTSYVTKKPILFLGTGQNYEDLQPFSKQRLINLLFD